MWLPAVDPHSPKGKPNRHNHLMVVSKDCHAVATADGGREGEVRYCGEIGSDGGSVRRFMRKPERPGVRLRFCYEAGPTGYGRLIPQR